MREPRPTVAQRAALGPALAEALADLGALPPPPGGWDEGELAREADPRPSLRMFGGAVLAAFFLLVAVAFVLLRLWGRA